MNILDENVIKINLFCLTYVATRNFKIIYVSLIVFLLYGGVTERRGACEFSLKV